MKAILRTSSLIFLILTLVACGGSGGGGGSEEVDPDSETIHTGKGFNKARGFSYTVRTTTPANDGSGDTYVGGDFLSYSDNKAGRLIRLNADGTVDKNFDTFSGNGFNKIVNIITATTDGSGDIYVGGDFTRYNGVSVNRVVRLNNDGSLDTNFDTFTGTGFDKEVRNILLANDNSGAIYVGGKFGSYNGVSVTAFVRISMNGALEAEFPSGTNVLAIVPGTSGNVYASGSYILNGNKIFRFLLVDNMGKPVTNTTFTNNIGTGFNNDVYDIIPVSGANGAFYVHGNFTQLNGVAVKTPVKLTRDGVIDQRFVVGSGFSQSGNFLSGITKIVPKANGSIYVGGSFDKYNGKEANGLVLLRSNGSVVQSFNAGSGANNGLVSLSVSTDGSGDIFIGGNFKIYNGTAVNRFARINNNGNLDSNTVRGSGISGFYSGNVEVVLPAKNRNGDVYIGGGMSSYNGHQISSLLRVNSTGEFDSRFTPIIQGDIKKIFPAADNSGDVYLQGGLGIYNGQTVNDLVRINSDGSLDTVFDVFNQGGFDNNVNDAFIVNDSSDTLYIHGSFTTYKGIPVSQVVRLTNEGVLDSGFNLNGSFLTSSGLDATIYSIAPAINGGVYVSGNFSTFNTTAVNQIVRLTQNGDLDLSFNSFVITNPNSGDAIKLITNASGELYAYGKFTHYNTEVINGFIKIKSDGSRDTKFNIGSALTPYFLNTVNIVGNDVYVAVENISTQLYSLLRLNTDGSINTIFQNMIGSGFDDEVYSVAYANDGSNDIFIGGNFSSFNGATVDGVVRLNLNGTID